MIGTIKPFGAINESEVRFVTTRNKSFFLIDNYGNRWGVTHDIYKLLQSKDIPNKEEQ